MIDDLMLIKLASTFGLYDFYIGQHQVRDRAGQEVDRIRVGAFWCAEIAYFDPKQKFYVSVIHFDKGVKGVVLIPPNSASDEREFAGRPLPHSLDLSGWDDPVVSSLQAINIMYFDYMMTVGGGFTMTHMRIGSDTCKAEFSFIGRSANESLRNLWKSLLFTTYHLVDLYDDEDMHKFINQQPRITPE
jgi:hypothetical protein